MKKILFPTDFSETANNAFIYALHFASQMKASILTLHTYELPDIGTAVGYTLPNTLQAFYESIDINELENFKEALPSLRKIADDNGFDQIEMKHALVSGIAKSTILEVANDENIDLIVMGTDGARGFKEIFVGTRAAEIMENANCPVLAVPSKATFDGKLDNFAVTTEYKEEEIHGIQKLLSIANLLDAHVTCLNVDLSHTHEYLDKMKNIKSVIGDKNISYKVLDGIRLEQTILRYLTDNKIDILAMVTHKRNFIEELFQNSFTKQLAYHSTVPILSIQAHTLEVMT